MQTCRHQTEKEAQAISLICLPFAHRINVRFLFVHLLTEEQMELIRLQTD
jgi:hypothetical protein